MMGMKKRSFYSTMCRCRSGENQKYEVNEETIHTKYHVYDLYDGKYYHGTIDQICQTMGAEKDAFTKIMQKANRGASNKYIIKEDCEAEWMDR